MPHAPLSALLNNWTSQLSSTAYSMPAGEAWHSDKTMLQPPHRVNTYFCVCLHASITGIRSPQQSPVQYYSYTIEAKSSGAMPQEIGDSPQIQLWYISTIPVSLYSFRGLDATVADFEDHCGPT
ncbi:Hypothetical predicted protein [Pelobates cultripes]|uniref:Uncharacterized protein n=1 Tax=Pelobates cultripes TaxID=61616 RepID=A0AAD1RC53_PELCU|nr:Hypothetical predicted protein [Pelobates cultripes]